MSIKRENDEFFVITLKHVSILTVVLNQARTQNYVPTSAVSIRWHLQRTLRNFRYLSSLVLDMNVMKAFST